MMLGFLIFGLLSFVVETRQYSRQITKCHIYQCFTNLYSKSFQPLTVFSKNSILDVFSYDSNIDDDEFLSHTLGDVLMISESKLHSSFPDGQFLIESYSAAISSRLEKTYGWYYNFYLQ